MNTRLILFAVLLVLAFTVGVYFVGRKSGGLNRSQLSKEAKDRLDAEIRAEKIPLSIDRKLASSFASELLKSMQGWGTDEEAIYKILDSLAGRADYLLVKKEFGLAGGRNLEEWLEDEFNFWDGQRINQILARFNVQL